MSVKKYLFRLERMHQLISKGATGNPDQFARRLGMDRSLLFKYLSEMKELGAPITYDRFSESYCYTEAVEFSPYFTTGSSNVADSHPKRSLRGKFHPVNE